MLTLDQAKNNLRIDYDEDDDYITMLLTAAQQYILGAIEIKELPEDDKRVDVLQFMLLSLWYENRVPATNAMQQEVPFTVKAMIHQLRGIDDGEHQDS